MAAVARLVGCAGTRVDISSKTVSSSDDSHFESPSKRVKRATAVDQDPAGSFMKAISVASLTEPPHCPSYSDA